MQKLKTFLTSLRNIVQKAITTHFEGFFELYKIGLLIFPKPEVKWPKPEVEMSQCFSTSGSGHLTACFSMYWFYLISAPFIPNGAIAQSQIRARNWEKKVS